MSELNKLVKGIGIAFKERLTVDCTVKQIFFDGLQSAQSPTKPARTELESRSKST
jgi:hypothetical protein